ncbi:hypothetical protein HQN89_28520 [Paenibacillus frigoriresistens]|uniref:hypothetical protein n=1 Tax=Paenibacillus alginolyticus TaxID=59839 RepID=UPI0015649224|nr:hypothetical protein [Paenibacillus frigoriresistens]NRF94839.1 hypothetical protein [Paenibacillus frigoriresistens]
MYKSVINQGKFLVVITDGVFDTPIIELPTEELADRMAYELQTARDEGETWGVVQILNQLDGDKVINETKEALQKLRSMDKKKKDDYLEKIRRRHERVQKVQQARRWKSVLSWKKKHI